MDVLWFFIMPILWFGSSIAAVIYAIKWLVKAISRKETKLVKRKFLVSLCMAFCLLIVIGAFYPGEEDEGEKTAQDNNDSTYSEDVETTEPTWKSSIPAGVAIDLEYAFAEIDENIDEIECIEYVGEKTTALFVRRDYKVSLTMGYEHSRWYRITTEEWNEGEPEREKYPREYLVTIKFWAEDNSTNINQWTASGNGELQDSSAGEYIPTVVDEIVLPTGIGESSANPIVISVADLVKEINADIDAAKEMYNGKWVEISGKVTYISESAGMTGYYLHGEKGGNGLKITCWVYDENAVNLSVGDSVTFVGAMREISTVNNTEIGLCVLK